MAALTGCSGPAGEAVRLQAGAIRATLQVTIPQQLSSSVRHAAYLTPTTREIDVIVNGGAPNVFTVPGPGTYSFSVPVAPGNASFTVSAYNSSHGLISTVTTSALMTASGPNVVNAQTLPVVSRIGLVIQAPTLFAGSAASSPVTVGASDVDGNFIAAGTYAQPIILSVSSGSAHVSFSPGSVSNPSTPVTLNYDGVALSPAIVSVIAQSGSASNAMPFATGYHLYVAIRDSSTNAYVVAIDGANTASQSPSGTMGNVIPTQIAVNPAGGIGYVGLSTTVQRFTIAAFVPSLSGAFSLVNPLYVSASGGAFFAGDGSSVYRINDSASPSTTLIAAASGQQYLDSDGSNVYFGSSGAAAALRAAPIGGGAVTSAGPTGTSAGGVAVRGQYAFLVDTVGKMLDVFPLPLTGGPFGSVSTGLTGTHIGLAVSPDTTRAYTYDAINGKLAVINTGNHLAPSAGPPITGLPSGQAHIAIDPAGGYLYLSAQSAAATTITRVNLQSGTTSTFNVTAAGAYALYDMLVAP